MKPTNAQGPRQDDTAISAEIVAQLNAIFERSEAGPMERANSTAMAMTLHKMADHMAGIASAQASQSCEPFDAVRLVRTAFLVAATIAQDERIATPTTKVIVLNAMRGNCSCWRCRTRRLLASLRPSRSSAAPRSNAGVETNVTPHT